MPLTPAELNTNLTDPEVIFNYIEAAFWIVMGLILGVTALLAKPPYRRLSLLASVVLVCFGLSDVVEAQTGAWWRPIWLLLWKAACLIALAWSYWYYRKLRKRPQQTTARMRSGALGPLPAPGRAAGRRASDQGCSATAWPKGRRWPLDPS
jgi:H+/Cl- antiporter ClcA